MKFIRVTTVGHPMYEQAMALYKESFPLHEQRRGTSQREIMGEEDYHFQLIYDRNIWVGILLYWETKEFQYVEHFCIRSELRGKRYGQKALEWLKAEGKCVILEIDPPIDSISIRRKDFYMRAGFTENPFSHVHPPYRAGFQGHPLVVLSAPTSLSQEMYQRFATYLKDTVMDR